MSPAHSCLRWSSDSSPCSLTVQWSGVLRKRDQLKERQQADSFKYFFIVKITCTNRRNQIRSSLYNLQVLNERKLVEASYIIIQHMQKFIRSQREPHQDRTNLALGLKPGGCLQIYMAPSSIQTVEMAWIYPSYAMHQLGQQDQIIWSILISMPCERTQESRVSCMSFIKHIAQYYSAYAYLLISSSSSIMVNLKNQSAPLCIQGPRVQSLAQSFSFLCTVPFQALQPHQPFLQGFMPQL